MTMSVHTFSMLDQEKTLDQKITILTPDELKRADRFRFKKHRRRFIMGRYHLRCILSEYLGIQPDTIRFLTQLHGKPFILPEQNPGKVSFNLSHSHELGVVVICRENDIGVDVEYLDKERPFMELAHRYFKESEVQLLESLSSEKSRLMFYKIWTMKEAWLKATGMGIMGLNLVETGIDNDTEEMKITKWGQDNPSFPEYAPAMTGHFFPEDGYIAAYTRLYSSQTVSTR